MRVVDISNYDADVDRSSGRDWVAEFRAAGVEALIIGSQWMDKARWQLACAKAGGLPVIATYAEPDVEDTITLAQEAGAGTVCLVIEPGGIQNVDLLRKGIAQVHDAGLKPVLYGNRGDVLATTGGSDEFKALPLWLASYFDDHRILTSVEWWPTLWGHQFTSTMTLAGRNRDVNEVFGEDLMEKYRWKLIRVADGPYGLMHETYSFLHDRGFFAIWINEDGEPAENTDASWRAMAERECLRWLAAGPTAKDACDALGWSV